MVLPMPIIGTYHILCSNKEKRPYIQTIMIAITDEEEKGLDTLKDKTIYFERENRVFEVTTNMILCYGDVDFNNGSNDLKIIDTFKFLNHLGWVGVHIRSGYDYETHSCSFPGKTVLWTETWSPSLLAQIAHGYLGKPDKILLFNQIVK